MSTNRPDNLPPRGPRMPQPRPNRNLITWLLFLGMGLLAAMYFTGQFDQSREIGIRQFWTHVDNNDLTGDLIIERDRIRGELKDSVPLDKSESRKFYVTYTYMSHEGFQDELNRRLQKAHSDVDPKYPSPSWWSDGAILQIVLMVGVVLLLWFLVFRRIGGGAGGAGFLGNFGRSKHRLMTKESSKVTFADVAGVQEAKDEVAEIIEFLKNPRKFTRLGGRVPRGVLLIGEPGCGKTLLAKAIAGEADVPFFSISGSDFVEMFVGVGASRVRDLFKQAKDNSPCIIFLDEIDAVGRRRGTGFNGGGHDEREQTLNAILVEMDGFDSSDQVIVISATNRADILDPALTRPGRFDRQIQVPLPDLKGRYEILRIYADRVVCGPDVDLHRLARGTPMFSGADLAALVNEAAIAATMLEKEFVEQSDLEEARDKVRWGRSRKSRVIDEKEREITAYHEAGHALVQTLAPESDPLHKVSIIPRGQMGGATFALPEKDRYLHTRRYCQDLLCVLLAGRMAEEIFCDDITSGASNDIMKVTNIARRMVVDWGMSEKLGTIRYAPDEQRLTPMGFGEREYSDATAEQIDAEIQRIVREAFDRTRKLIEEHRDALERIAQALMKYETLSADEVQSIIDGKVLDKPTVNDLLDAEVNKPNGQPAEPEPPAEATEKLGDEPPTDTDAPPTPEPN